MVLTVLKGLGKAYLKSKAKGITSVPPNVPKTDMQKAIRTLKVEGHKIKAKLSKIESDVFDRTQKLKKSIEKIKTPEKTKHYYKVRD